MEKQALQAWKDALSWVMTQPGLIEGLPGGHAPLMETSAPRLTQLLHGDQQGLFALLQGPRAHKLGIAFEALMLWGLEQALGYECLARDVQIQDGKRTMGALDFVLQAPDGAIEHWELAYKLFLQSDPDLGWSSWLGPRGRDRLDAKLQRMLEHQLPLSSTPQAHATLCESLGLPKIDRKRLMMQGVLFSPWGAPPQRATKAHKLAEGRWLRPSALPDLLQTDPHARWVLRENPLWFGPCRQERDCGITTSALLKSVRPDPLVYPQLWSRLPDTSQADESMLFIVAETWARPPKGI